MARSGAWMLFSGMVATAAGFAVVCGNGCRPVAKDSAPSRAACGSAESK
jgi:hypothetical protein